MEFIEKVLELINTYGLAYLLVIIESIIIYYMALHIKNTSDVKSDLIKEYETKRYNELLVAHEKLDLLDEIITKLSIECAELKSNKARRQ